MKRCFKLFLVILSLTVVIGLASTFAASAEETENDNSEVVEETVEDIAASDISSTYTDEEENLVLVLEDGRKYNVTKQEWVVEESESTGMTLKVNPDNMLSSLQYMWKGMLCIFVVIGVIILSVYFMGFVFSKFEAKKED